MKEAPRSVLCARVAGTLLSEAMRDVRKRLEKRTVTDTDVHEARKALKRARAALRMLRDAIGEGVYRRENAALRDAGRQLSAVRDATATRAALEALLDQHASEHAAADTVELRRQLEDDVVCARRVLRRPSAKLDAANMLVDQHQRILTQLDVGTDDGNALRAGLKRIYRKGRRAMKAARTEETPEAFHEWRKQVKYLLNAVAGIQDCLKPDSEKVSRRADKLADRLGDDHDLAVLLGRMRRATIDSDQPLVAVISKRRRKLQRRAIDIGNKLYDRGPSRFVAHLMG